MCVSVLRGTIKTDKLSDVARNRMMQKQNLRQMSGVHTKKSNHEHNQIRPLSSGQVFFFVRLKKEKLILALFLSTMPMERFHLPYHCQWEDQAGIAWFCF